MQTPEKTPLIKSSRQVDKLSNIIGACQLGCGALLMFGVFDTWKVILAMCMISSVGSWAQGKGVPTIPQLISELENVTGRSPMDIQNMTRRPPRNK